MSLVQPCFVFFLLAVEGPEDRYAERAGSEGGDRAEASEYDAAGAVCPPQSPERRRQENLGYVRARSLRDDAGSGEAAEPGFVVGLQEGRAREVCARSETVTRFDGCRAQVSNPAPGGPLSCTAIS